MGTSDQEDHGVMKGLGPSALGPRPLGRREEPKVKLMSNGQSFQQSRLRNEVPTNILEDGVQGTPDS